MCSPQPLVGPLFGVSMSSSPESVVSEAQASVAFADLALPEAVQKALTEKGYTNPTPIQAEIIPHVLAGHDVIGQAQTGTGKTAAFALPLLARLDPHVNAPQVLVLAPTRELAGQVAEACMDYGKYVKGMKVAAVYGGAGYGDQLRDLKRGAQVVIGTPGRVMDHIKRGTLNLSDLRCMVLDEADEMLQMGFIDDVEWILSHTPEERQVALFSATMPQQIRNISKRYLKKPIEVKIKAATASATTVSQRYWFVRGSKDDALARILEAEKTDGVMVFTRTRRATTDVAKKLRQHGIKVSALNGDMAQSLREQTVDQLKNGELDVLVATDVAARGLDVPRISHVVNYDIPENPEIFVHRIGRTGRAGRTGQAILFVRPSEKRGLKDIERHIKRDLDEMELPDAAAINKVRADRFAEHILATAAGDLTDFEGLVSTIIEENGLDPVRAAAALASLVHGDKPLFIKDEPKRSKKEKRREREAAGESDGHDYYRINVGFDHDVRPGMIVGAIANELGIAGHSIGHINIHGDHSTVALPAGMPDSTFQALSQLCVMGQRFNATRLDGEPPKSGHGSPSKRRAHRNEGGRYSDKRKRAGGGGGSGAGNRFRGSKAGGKKKAHGNKRGKRDA